MLTDRGGAVMRQLKDNLIPGGIQEKSECLVLGQQEKSCNNCVMCEKRGGANTQISVLFGMTCLHDSSNFDFTPTGQKGEL